MENKSRIKPIWIGNDHGGYELKLQIMSFLEQKGCQVHDVGSDSLEIVRYPYFAAKVAEAVSSCVTDRGILICSTGIGMSIVANKLKNIRASMCTSVHMAKMTRAHNDSNILCLGGKITELSEALEILETWLATGYEGGRHAISLDLLKQIENENFSDRVWHPIGPMV